MPPAFVLSQDQTLMFNPQPIPAQEPIAIRAFTTLHFRCEVSPTPSANVDDPRRRPRIPSYSTTMSINKPCLATLEGPRRAGRRLISSSPRSVNGLLRLFYAGRKPAEILSPH